MYKPSQPSQPAVNQAAELAFALIRFESAAAHLSRFGSPPGEPRVGEDAYLFTPSWRPVSTEHVVAFLAGLSSPALFAATTARGIIALTLVDELSGERAAWGRKWLSNQRAALDEVTRARRRG